MIFANKRKKTEINTGLINLDPFFTTIFEPIRLPAIPAIAAGIPMINKTFPLTMKVIIAAILDAELITFVLPLATTKSYFKTNA